MWAKEKSDCTKTHPSSPGAEREGTPARSMPRITRSRVQHLSPEPVALRRTSALIPIRFTRKGRAQARRMCIDEYGTYALYFLERDGVTTYHLADCRTDRPSFAFEDEALIPEYTRRF